MKKIAPYEKFILYFDIDHKRVKAFEKALAKHRYQWGAQVKDDWVRYNIETNCTQAFLLVRIFENFR